jgi:hypothetical protein
MIKGLWKYNLLWWKVEGLNALNGLNVYRLSDPNSAGFWLKCGKLVFRLRYSKRTKKLHCGFKLKKEVLYD